MTGYSKNAQRLIKILSEEEILQTRKDNPFRIERNNRIRALYNRGVTQVVLAEVSGLSNTSISRICCKKRISERSVHKERG